MDSSKLNIYYYNINIDDNSNNRIDYLQYIHTDSSYNIYNNKGVTCELMSPSNSENVLTCFYEVNSPNSLAATSFILDNPISLSNSIPIIYKENGMPGYFKSALNSDKTKALICYSPNGQGGNCIFYNITNNSFSEDKHYFVACQNLPKGLHVDYFEKTKEFIASCSDSGIGLSIMKFDEKENILNTNKSCIESNYWFDYTTSKLYSFSVIYLSEYSEYTILYTGNAQSCKFFLFINYEIKY